MLLISGVQPGRDTARLAETLVYVGQENRINDTASSALASLHPLLVRKTTSPHTAGRPTKSFSRTTWRYNFLSYRTDQENALSDARP